MRGGDDRTEGLFSYVSCEARVPATHPLRLIRGLVDEALELMSPDFEGLYSKIGRPSIPPEKLLRALLLQAFYSIRSERQLMEQMDYNLLFRWFVGLSMDSAVWDATTFSKNRDRLLDGEVARRFLAVVVEQARRRGLLSDDHFSVDGTLIEAWASIKSFRPKDGGDEPPGPGRNSERTFHGEKRSNETHASTTDPDARLYRKGNGQSSRMACQLIGRWRIVEANLWDRGYLVPQGEWPVLAYGLPADRPVADRRGQPVGPRLSRPRRARRAGHSRRWSRRDRLRRSERQPRPGIRPIHRVLHLGRLRRDGRSQRFRIGRTPRRRIVGD